MRLFVGLGNPGARYAGNRHNIGFMAVERIAEDHGFGPWRAKFQGALAEGRLGSEKVLLLKPGTFMNLSGQSVRAAVDFHKLEPADVTVFHDELDLAPGKVRVKQGGGHAGHNGLRSIHAHLGESYARVRLGIGHPGHKDRVAAYVLQDFAKADADWLEDVLRGVSDGAAALAAGDGPRFLNAVALRTAPPRSSTGPGGGGKRPRTRDAGRDGGQDGGQDGEKGGEKGGGRGDLRSGGALAAGPRSPVGSAPAAVQEPPAATPQPRPDPHTAPATEPTDRDPLSALRRLAERFRRR